MYKKIIPLLVCPQCKKGLTCYEEKTEKEDVIEGFVSCDEGHKFCIHKGVLDFGSLEQEGSNSWSEYYKDSSYEDLDEAIEAQKSENQKSIQKLFLDSIVGKAISLEDGFLLDIASGRGMLLRKLIESANENIHIIATDLSFAVLMYDRIKFCGLNPKVKVSYIACDATNLPFKTNSIDRICTFAGYLNMGNLFEPGIAEAARVKKESAILLNSIIYMKPDTPGYEEVKNIVEEYGMSEMAKCIVQDSVLDIHRNYFEAISDEIVYEGIAEGEEGDLLPYKDEWFAYAIITAK